MLINVRMPAIIATVNVLKFQTLVACQKGLDKQCRPRSDCFWRSSLIRVSLFAILTSSWCIPVLITKNLVENRKRNVFEILENLPYLTSFRCGILKQLIQPIQQMSQEYSRWIPWMSWRWGMVYSWRQSSSLLTLRMNLPFGMLR